MIIFQNVGSSFDIDVQFQRSLGFNFFSLIPVVLLALGAFLGFFGAQADVKKTRQSTWRELSKLNGGLALRKEGYQ